MDDCFIYEYLNELYVYVAGYRVGTQKIAVKWIEIFMGPEL